MLAISLIVVTPGILISFQDPNGNQIYLGVTHLGIVTFQGNKRTRIFTW